jgi:hypothetical protein
MLPLNHSLPFSAASVMVQSLPLQLSQQEGYKVGELSQRRT